MNEFLGTVSLTCILHISHACYILFVKKQTNKPNFQFSLTLSLHCFPICFLLYFIVFNVKKHKVSTAHVHLLVQAIGELDSY